MPDLWNVLHDGTIMTIDGNVPGDVELKVRIPYLREMWPGSGESLLILLEGCETFEWHIFGKHNQTIVWEDLKMIAHSEPEIRSATSDGDTIRIYIRGIDSHKQGNEHPLWELQGELRLKYKNLHLALDNGKGITLDEVKEKASQYWENQRE